MVVPGATVGAAVVAVTSGMNLCRVAVGAAVGAIVGAAVDGAVVALGACVAAGAAVGAIVGAAVGAIAGAAVGAGAGATVGAAVGAAVGSSSPPPHATITSKSPPNRANIANTFQVAGRHVFIISTPNQFILGWNQAYMDLSHIIVTLIACQQRQSALRITLLSTPS